MHHAGFRLIPGISSFHFSHFVVLQVTIPTNGQAVSLLLLLRSKNIAAIQLEIKISVQAMRYNDVPAANIQNNVKNETLQPFKGEYHLD